MSKYAPFADFLRGQATDSVEVSFEHLSRLVNGLPASAWDHDAWWANSSTGRSHTWAQQWAAAGWRCVSANRQSGVAVFQRVSKTTQRRLPASELRKITAEHIWSAVQALLGGATADGFAESTDYDLIAEGGVRLSPKQVFGIAAASALGFSVTPAHFSGGLDTICFELLGECGYLIVPKGGPDVAPPDLTEDARWTEGRPRLVTHLLKERAPGLSKAKKAAFVRIHGQLFCEECRLDPRELYGEDGDACIEVHHDHTSVSDMKKGHVTKLVDLKCLCANCHRVEHSRLRRQRNQPLR